MTAEWIETFLADGPDYAAERRSVAEIQALLLKAGLGAELPLGHAQDFSGMAGLFMSDPKLFAMAAAALEGPHYAALREGTAEHQVIERARIAMAAPAIWDAFQCGAQRVILRDLDWPQLLWPVMLRAEQLYGIELAFDVTDRQTIMVSLSQGGPVKPLDAPQSVPLLPLSRLETLAAKTYVPASDASRLAGAGAGLSDND